MKLLLKKLHQDAQMPVYSTAGAANFDIHCIIEGESKTDKAGQTHAPSITVSPGPAMAAETNVPVVAVRTSDLNLSDPAAQQQLDRRIDRAARKMCGLDQVRTGTMLPSPQAKACYRNAVRSTRDQLARIEQNARRGG